jgi:nucleoside-diphosphate-sugar epimerase
MRPLTGRRVLVTGGTGFIGGRVVEKLVLEHGARVRVLASSYARAARPARFDVELLIGDVGDRAVARRAAEGCDVIVHCAYGSRGSARERRRVTVDGSRAVLDAACDAGAQRVVHVSTMMVYGAGVEGRLDEGGPRRWTGIAYADAKREAEDLALRYAHDRGLPVAVVQPTAVYGPYGPSWTERVVTELASSTVALIDGGDGLANPVYVDDVADALLLAAVRDEAVGEAFLVSSGERVTWREFYGRFEAMLGVDSTVSISREEAKALYAASRRRRWLLGELVRLMRSNDEARERLLGSRELAPLARTLRRVAAMPVMRPLFERIGVARVRRVAAKGGAPAADAPAAGAPTAEAPAAGAPTAGAPTRWVPPQHPKLIDFLSAKTEVSIEKARRLLGYQPAFGLDEGMALTEAYLRWAALLPSREAPCA